jgi:hypothetical protein
MAVYFVTGKLGSGKSLMSVKIIRDYLYERRVVASNLDLNLKYIVGPKGKHVKAFRIPDRPTSHDLLAIGRGNNTKDETKNGGLFLDECGIWFNTRNWNASGRQDIINFLLMARKLGWDIYIIVQNISLIDKQARDSVAEYVAYCTRLDRLHIPFVSFFYKLVTGTRLPLPKIHTAIVKMGTSHNGLKSESWTLVGTDLYSAYNTQQIFLQDSSDQAVFSYLPPTYYCNNYIHTWGSYMRLTKIYFKKYKRVPLIFAGAFLGFLLSTFYGLSDLIQPAIASKKPLPSTEIYQDYWISSYSQLPGEPLSYSISDGKKTFLSSQLIKSGIQVYIVDRCFLQLTNASQKNPLDIRCKDGSL